MGDVAAPITGRHTFERHTMKTLFASAAIAISLACSGPALAHGAKPKHGGIIASAADLAFELVAANGKAVIYVDDHGRALSTRDAKGTLTVLQKGKKSQSMLEASGDNTLTSTSAVKLAKGTRAVASITLPGKEPLSVRFSVR